MSKLADLKRQHPEYAALTDQELADRLHATYYADMPRGEFNKRIGLAPKLPRPQAAAIAVGDFLTSNMTDEIAGNVSASVGYTADAQRRQRDALRRGDVLGSIGAAARGFAAPLEATVRGLTGTDAQAPSQARARTTEQVRELQTRARTERPGTYYGTGVLTSLVPGVGLSRAMMRPLAASSATAVRGAAPLLSAAGTGAVLAGAGAGGDAEGTIVDRAPIAAAAAPIGAGLGIALQGAVGGVQRGVEAGARQLAARSAARQAQANAANILSRASVQAVDDAAVDRMSQEIATAAADPSGVRAIADEFGVPIARSQAASGAPVQSAWLFEALDGNHGGRAQEMARKLVEQQYDAVPQALQRVVGGEARVPDAATGARSVQDALLARNAAERQAESEAWDALEPFGNVKLRASDAGKAGFRRMGDAVSERLTAEGGKGFDGYIPFAHPSEIVRAEAFANYPKAAALFARVQQIATTRGTRNEPGTFRELISLRRFAREQYENAATPGDQRMVQIVRNAIDDWMDTELPGQIRKRGEGAVEAYSRARKATRENRALFEEDKRVAKMIDDEIDAVRAFDKVLGGAQGTTPAQGAHVTMRALKNRFGAESEEWRLVQETVLRRFGDQLERAVARDNFTAMRTVYNQLDNLLTRHREFVTATFEPAQIAQLVKLRALLQRLQSPGPGASNPSRSGVVASKLVMRSLGAQDNVMGALTNVAADIRAGGAMRRELRPVDPPSLIAPIGREALTGLALGPTRPGLVGATAVPLVVTDQRERERRARMEMAR